MSAARILVVDDEADINTVLSVTLRRAGYEVVSAADGVEAAEAFERQAPDLVLLDVMMPRADGLETLRRIRAHGPTAHVPVIMLTARSTLTKAGSATVRRGAGDERLGLGTIVHRRTSLQTRGVALGAHRCAGDEGLASRRVLAVVGLGSAVH